ncbi:MAG: hypothetical protein ACRC5A_13335 [Enterobacteriaceae bacterium]
MSHYGLFWLLLLMPQFILAGDGEARDPFMERPEPPCVGDNRKKWRLLGTLAGRQGDFGWGLSPEGTWVRFAPQQQAGNSPWQVARIESDRVILRLPPTAGCPAQMRLTVSFNDAQ